MGEEVVPLRWVGAFEDGHLEMIDQKLLPSKEVWVELKSAEEVAEAITSMVIRGAPAIGIAAAFGMALGVRALGSKESTREIPRLIELLSKTRPTAVNLFWALERCRRLAQTFEGGTQELASALFVEAQKICDDDRANNRRMGQLGADLLPENARVLTHCNTGALATGGYGTALGIIRAAHEVGKLKHVWIDETRPYLQGARLTAWECVQENIPATLITDSMAAHFMKLGEVDAVIVGTDRVVKNGDVANKIGTYGLAVLCHHHQIPFYVAAPLSTIDLETPHGDSIIIEERSPREITHIGGHALAPEGMPVAHPAFDVTPAALVTAIITEAGVVRAPYEDTLKTLFPA